MAHDDDVIDSVSYEIDTGETIITVTASNLAGGLGRVTVARQESGPLRVKVTDLRGFSKATEAEGVTSLSVNLVRIGKLIEQSDLPETEKREARNLLQNVTPQNVLLFLNIVKGSNELWAQIAPHLSTLLNWLK